MDFELIKASTVGFVQHNQSWAPFVVAGLAFGNRSRNPSLFVPATGLILIAIGALIGVAGLEFWQIWLGAAVGAAIGDSVSLLDWPTVQAGGPGSLALEQAPRHGRAG